jgi:hypothetical protein
MERYLQPGFYDACERRTRVRVKHSGWGEPTQRPWPYTLYSNFGRVHQTLRVTPAMEAGVSDHVWSIEESFVWWLKGVTWLKRPSVSSCWGCWS